MDGGAWWAAVHGVAKSRTRLSNFTFIFHSHALKKEMATHSSVLALRIPGTWEPGGLPSIGSHRVGHEWSNLAAAAAACSFFWIYQTFSYIELYLSTYSFLLQRLLVVSTITKHLALFFYSNRILIFTCAHVFFGASQMALVVMNPTVNAGDRRDVGWIPGSGRSPGGGRGNPLQYSCLENPMDRGAWQATYSP